MIYNPEYVKLFYTRHIADGKEQGSELRAPCPAHDDKEPSFSANLTSGLYKCFHPDCKLSSGGGLPQFLAVINDIPISEAASIIDKEHEELYPHTSGKKKTAKANVKFPFTNDDLIDRMNVLLQHPDKMAFLKKKCLWTEETVKKFRIGWDIDTGKFWVPIIENVEIMNLRRYSPERAPKWSSISGFGGARMFPMDNVQGDVIYIFEGEKDCILANQLGLNAITVTGGAGTFDTSWKKHFIGKDVVICYDVDTAGRQGAYKVFSTIGNAVKSVKVIDLPIDTPENADFTDYILAGNTIQDFHALVEQTEEANPPSDAAVDIPDEIEDATLDQVTSELRFYKRSRSKVRVIGGESSPFVIPRICSVTCNRDFGKWCDSCHVGDKGGDDRRVINETTPRVLDMIECSAVQKMNIVKDIFHIPAGCRKFKVKEQDHQSINRVSIIPCIDEISYNKDTQNQNYVERELYFIGDKLEVNNDFEIDSIAVPSPKDQSLVHLGYRASPADSSIEEFNMTPELKQQLEIFQCQYKNNLTESIPT